MLSVGGTWKCGHLGDLFSSHNSGRSPGGEQTPDSAAVQHLEELNAGSDQDDIPGQEGCPSPGVIPYPAAALTAAVWSRPGCAASADLREAPSCLSEESFLESDLVPTTGEELVL